MNIDSTKSKQAHQLTPLLRIERKNQNKGFNLKQERKIEGIPLRKLQLLESFHQSVVLSSRNSSMHNVVNSTLYNNSQAESDFSVNNNLQNFSIQSQFFNNRSNNESTLKKPIEIMSKRKSDLSLQKSSYSMSKFEKRKSWLSTQKQSPDKPKLPQIKENRQTTIENILKKYIDTNFIQSLIQFLNKDWEEQQNIILKQKRFEALRNLITQKTNFVNQLIDDFMTLQIEKYEQKQKKIMISLLFKQSSSILKGYDNLFLDILKKIPQDKIVKQQFELESLHNKILEIFDPKYVTSNQKMKDRVQLFMGGYTSQKNNLLASIVTKLKPHLEFIIQIERYLNTYQKQIIKLRNQLQNSELEKTNLNKLLNKKVNFTPIEINYEKFKEMKDESKEKFFGELEASYVKVHAELHKKSDKIINRNQKQNEKLLKDLEAEKQKNQKLENIIYDIKNSIPKKKDMATQVYLLNSKQSLNNMASGSLILDFLGNVSTPFSFNEKITGSLINLLTIDKMLYDYEIVRHKYKLNSFSDFMVQWFIIRTGNKKVAQIFAKNFMYSVKQLKTRHKRFNLFNKFCGFSGFKKKNIMEDLQYVFFQTHKAWHLLIKIALKFRNRMNETPTGYQLLPPLQCEHIFKLPLRKVYEIIQEVLNEEQIEMPENLTNKIDHYAINEICKFKQHDQQFQKQQLQQIHILQNINFDVIAGFILEHVAQEKCKIVEKFLRAVTLKQKQMGDVVGYSQFEALYRKFYKEKRSKVELIYSNICVTNQNDLLNIQNSEAIIRAIIEDQSGLRNIFDENQTLKSLVITQKTNLKLDKRLQNTNSFENFRQRYYYEFYDFYNTTAFLQQIYRVIKNLIRTKLKSFIKDEKALEEMIAEKEPLLFITGQQKNKKQTKKDQESDDEDEYEDEVIQEVNQKEAQKGSNPTKKRNDLENKVEEWNKIVVRIPHFSKKVLTIDQIIVHNMRRKEMFEASQFAWRTLRDILVMIAKQ